MMSSEAQSQIKSQSPMFRSSRRPSRLVRVGLPWDARSPKKETQSSRGERLRAWPSLFSSPETLLPAFRESRDIFDDSREGGRDEIFRSAFNPNNSPPPAFNPSQSFNPSSTSSQQSFFVPSSSFSASGPFFASSGNRGQPQFVDQVLPLRLFIITLPYISGILVLDHR